MIEKYIKQIINLLAVAEKKVDYDMSLKVVKIR